MPVGRLEIPTADSGSSGTGNGFLPSPGQMNLFRQLALSKEQAQGATLAMQGVGAQPCRDPLVEIGADQFLGSCIDLRQLSYLKAGAAPVQEMQDMPLIGPVLYPGCISLSRGSQGEEQGSSKPKKDT